MDSLNKFKHVLIKAPANNIYQVITPIYMYEIPKWLQHIHLI